MENTGNSGSGGSPPSNGTLVWYLEPSELETAEVLQTLFDTFQATRDLDYLSSAIGVAEQLAVSDRRNLSTLKDLIEIRDTHMGGGQRNLEQANVESESENIVLDNNLEGGTSNKTSPPHTGSDSATGLEKNKLLQTFRNMSAATGEVDYLESMTGLAREDDLKQLLNKLMEFKDTLEQTHGDRGPALDDNQVGGRWNLGRTKVCDKGKARDTGVADGPQDESLAMTAENYKALMNSLETTGLILGLKRRFDTTNEIEHLDNAILLTEGLICSFPGEANLPGPWVLIDLLNKRYDQTGELEDLERIKKAVEATPPNDTLRGGVLGDLAVTHLKRYNRLGEVEDLEQAIERAEEAIAAIPPGNLERAETLGNLGFMFSQRYNRYGAQEDLDRAITVWREAAGAVPPGNPGRNRFGAPEDPVEATKPTEKAVAATPPNRAATLTGLTTRLGSRYRTAGAPEDLAGAIRWAEVALAETPLQDPNRATLLHILGMWLLTRYDKFGAPGDLAEAIRYMEETLAATPPEDSERAALLSNLATRLSARYSRSGEWADLTESTRWAVEALAATPLGDTHRAERLTNLSGLLFQRYTGLGPLVDLAEAIRCAEEAVAATPEQDPRRAERMGTLSLEPSARYSRFRDPPDLAESIKWLEEALAATPLDAPNHSALLSTLCISRHELSGAPEDLARAIKYGEEAVATIPAEHPNRILFLVGLSYCLLSGYLSSLSPEYLERALEKTEAAVTATPPDHYRSRQPLLGALAVLVGLRYQLTGAIQDFDYILQISFEAWHSRIFPPRFRIHAARQAAMHLTDRKMWQESSSLLGDAVKMLSKISSLSARRDEQEHQISIFSRLAADAVSTAFQAGEEAAHCLRLLEFGRGVITSLVIDCRSDISELQSKHPELSDKFRNLRNEIDSPLAESLMNRAPIGKQTVRRREEVVTELDETLISIRGLPGFEGFQLPPHSEDLMAMACEGSIVIVNSTELRSDAIIITRSAVKAVALPKLIYKSAQEWMNQIAQLVQGSQRTYPLRNKTMEELLRWLWDVAVEPVFQSLQLDKVVDDSNQPRIWWIGIGLLATAPFHAAGDHSPGSARNTLSRAISSYIPTIKALSYARQKKLELLNKADSRLLLVSMPTTPGNQPLKNATKEVEDIISVIKDKIMTTPLDCPSSAQVLAELQSSHAVHFACHGVSDGVSPSNSSLLLRKDDGSETLDKLTVGTISNTKMEHAQIAYLSACSTAENSSTDLADESIYIASGFQLAGFSHVLATQWVSHDASRRQVAKDFYEALFDGQPGGEEGHRKVSAAFHYAVKRLRDGIWKQPIKWASFIHTGA